MTVFQLECFLEVARTGSFATASDNLYISAPTMSRQIRTLEEELQATLFVRGHNTVQLTGVGQEVYPELKQLYESYQEKTERIREIVDQRWGRLRIGVLDSVRVPAPFRSAVLELKRQFPKSQIQICHLNLRSAFQSLKDGAIDVLLTMNTIMPAAKRMSTFDYYRDYICLAVPSDHPNAGLEHITNEEIRTYFGDLNFSLIAADEFEEPVRDKQKSTLPSYADNYLDAISGPFAELDSLMTMVFTGLGITCVNKTSVLDGVPFVRLIPLVDRNADGTVIPHEVCLNPYWMETNENKMLHWLLDELRNDAHEPMNG